MILTNRLSHLCVKKMLKDLTRQMHSDDKKRRSFVALFFAAVDLWVIRMKTWSQASMSEFITD